MCAFDSLRLFSLESVRCSKLDKKADHGTTVSRAEAMLMGRSSCGIPVITGTFQDNEERVDFMGQEVLCNFT